MNAFAGRSDCQRAGRGGAETDKTIDPSPPALRLYRSDGNFTCCADPAVPLSDTGLRRGDVPGVRGRWAGPGREGRRSGGRKTTVRGGAAGATARAGEGEDAPEAAGEGGVGAGSGVGLQHGAGQRSRPRAAEGPGH